VSGKLSVKPAVATSVIEAAHDAQGDLQAWADQLLVACQSLFDGSLINLSVARRMPDHYDVLAASCSDPLVLEHTLAAIQRNGPRVFDHFYRFPGWVTSTQEVRAEHQLPAYEDLNEFHNMTHAQDSLGLVAIVNDVSMACGTTCSAPIRLGRRDRQFLTRVALHLETGLRLRLQPGAARMMLRPDGRVLDASNGLTITARQRASAHVGQVEASRTRRGRSQGTALELWTALVSGTWGLVERRERGIGRYYALLETDHTRHLRALSALEARVAELSARGLSGKAVAYGLGLTPSVVSRSLTSAALKLGVRSRDELVQLAASLLGTGATPPQGTAALSNAERDVLELIRLGFSNARIAAERQRSERTVANQVASLLRKLQVPSRRALGTVRAGHEGSPAAP
jgi:DNA-binding NarL/FixJ family response regulator